MVKKTKRVALLIETSRAYGRGVFAGIADFIASNPHWTILYQERYLEQCAPESLLDEKPDGILMRVGDPRISRDIIQLRIPVVDLLDEPRKDGCPVCLIDDFAVADLAADHFVNNGFINFAFCGFPNVPFSERRKMGFVSALRQRNFKASVYRSAGSTPNFHWAEEYGYRELESIARWLADLPKPIGLFACNDVRALQVLQACRLRDLPVPAAIAVLGVDNDEVITQLTQPKLTSIQPDTFKTGFQACICLDRLMAGKPPPVRIELIPPQGIAERESTNSVGTTDELVAAAIRLIRQRACEGLMVKEVLDALRISRTHLDTRFKEAIGHSVHEEIVRVKRKRVCQLLLASDHTLAEIAERTGYFSVSDLSRSFQRTFGSWPGEYRKRARSKVQKLKGPNLNFQQWAYSFDTIPNGIQERGTGVSMRISPN
jgi:LacI family transcriptional regulator